ncbi:MAG TPA: ABC transporter permease, partial [Pseudonocardiaceae bacterium]|nr:ABC transporter permease [Pseudonocardiaceae bacterium]
MTAGSTTSVPGVGALRQVGLLASLGWEVLRYIPRRPFQFREFIQQS